MNHSKLLKHMIDEVNKWKDEYIGTLDALARRRESEPIKPELKSYWYKTVDGDRQFRTIGDIYDYNTESICPSPDPQTTARLIVELMNSMYCNVQYGGMSNTKSETIPLSIILHIPSELHFLSYAIGANRDYRGSRSITKAISDIILAEVSDVCYLDIFFSHCIDMSNELAEQGSEYPSSYYRYIESAQRQVIVADTRSGPYEERDIRGPRKIIKDLVDGEDESDDTYVHIHIRCPISNFKFFIKPFLKCTAMSTNVVQNRDGIIDSVRKMNSVIQVMEGAMCYVENVMGSVQVEPVSYTDLDEFPANSVDSLMYKGAFKGFTGIDNMSEIYSDYISDGIDSAESNKSKPLISLDQLERIVNSMEAKQAERIKELSDKLENLNAENRTLRKNQ